MDYFKLLRDFWDFAFENPEKISPNHCALYCFVINHSNRLGRKEKLGLPTDMAKEAIGIKCYKRYISTLNDLIEWGFILMLEKSRNQYSSNIVALVYYDKPLSKALDKAMLMQSLRQEPSKPTINEVKTKKEEIKKKIDKNEIFGLELIENENWIESVCKQNNWIANPESKKKVAKWILEFNTKLGTELDVKHSVKDFGAHFSRWLPGEIQKQNKIRIAKEKDPYFQKLSKPKFLR
jgi:hypothetical protein